MKEFPARGIWHLALTRTSWNGRPATLDLRRWNEDYTRMSKGLTLTPEEYEQLKGGF
nr:PC4/YdbC family ssDNA-binding protein [Cuneatibacter sp. NSJ-177]